MKTNSFLNRVTKLMTLPLIVIAFTFSAQAADKKVNTNNDDPTSISYVTTTQKGILFNVKHDNAEGSKFRLIIKNAAGDVFYDQSFKDKSFDKNVVFTNEQLNGQLIFKIVAPGVDYNQAFNISSKQTTVNDVVINAQ